MSVGAGKEAMEAITHTSEEFAIIERIARIVSSVRGAKPDYTRLAAELEHAVPFDIFGVVLLRHDRQAVRVTVCQREGERWVAFYHQHPLKDSMVEQMLHSPVLVVKHYAADLDGPPAESGDALSRYHQLRSTLIAPLVVEDRVLGALELGSTRPYTYANESLQRLIHAVTDVLATAIESVQMGGSAAIQDRQRQALKDVTRALNAEMDLATILNHIVFGVSTALNVASGIVLLDRRGTSLRLEASAGLYPVELDRVFAQHAYLNERCILGQTLQHRQSFISQDIANDERFPASAFLFRELGLRSVLSYPLATGTTIYGVLFLGSSESGGFTPLKVDIFALFADQATIAIHNGMLLEAAHQRSRFQEAIERLEQVLQKSPPVDTVSENEETLADEFALLMHVREATKQTFGINFTSLLHLISDHLLTVSERNVQEFSPEQDAPVIELARYLHTQASSLSDELPSSLTRDAVAAGRKDPFAETMALLAQTAGAALMRAGMLGELSRLLVQLKQSTNWLKDAWFVVDLDGICTYMNPAAEILCDRRLEPGSASYSNRLLRSGMTVGPKIEDVFAKLLPRMRNVDEVLAYLQDVVVGSPYQQELRCVLAIEPLAREQVSRGIVRGRSLLLENAPTDYHYQVTRYPLSNQQGRLEAIALQVRDVSEQVRDEKNRSALLSSVSHDLRTPLTTIKAAVTGLLQTEVSWDEQDRREMLEDIDSETDHLTVLVNAVVELSRIEMGALHLEKEWCDVVEIIHGAVSRLQRVLDGCPVRISPPAGLPLIYVDHAQLERVFYNLLENAARHSPPRAEILIRLEASEGVPQMLKVRVIDHGPGIPVYEREHIFKSFYSLRSYNNGMGLAICKGIIEAHQGKIWVEEAEEGGSCFIFTLPTYPYMTAPIGKGEPGGRTGSGEKKI